MKKTTKRFFSAILSLVTVSSMSFYCEINTNAEENTEPEIVADADTDSELAETDYILGAGSFEVWYDEAKVEAATADHIIGPNGDISTSKYTLVMPDETIAILPEASASNQAIQGNITSFKFSVLQLSNPILITDKLTTSTPAVNGFTEVKTKTVIVPFADRTVLTPAKEPVASHEGLESYTYVSLYRNDTGLPIMLKGDYYSYPCTGESNTYKITGKNDSNLVNFQGWIKVTDTPEIYFLEPYYDITIDDSTIDGIIWAESFENSNKLFVDNQEHTYSFQAPCKAAYRFAGFDIDGNDAHVFWEFNNADHITTDKNSISYTFNFETYLKKYGINKVSTQKLVPNFKSSDTLEFFANSGKINGKDSCLCEVYFYSENYSAYGKKEFINIDEIKAVKDNSTFVGWCTDPDKAKDTLIKDTSEEGFNSWRTDDNTKLYAVWKSNAEPKPIKTSTGIVSSEGIYVFSDTPSIVAGLVHEKSDPTDDLEFRWIACDLGTGSWFELTPWTTNNEWLNWTPKSAGNYLINCYVRVIGNEEKSEIYKSVGVVYKKNLIKDICQMPYEGGGYLIGFETFDNPNQEYQYEMFVMDLSLLAAGSPTPWVHDTGAITLSGGKTLWTIWQPEYGYYITLFRLMDKDGNILDEVSYGFANAY